MLYSSGPANKYMLNVKHVQSRPQYIDDMFRTTYSPLCLANSTETKDLPSSLTFSISKASVLVKHQLARILNAILCKSFK